MINRPVVKIAKRGRNINSNDFEDFTFHSDETVVKVRLDTEQPHVDILEYTFGSEPTSGTTRLIEFEHEYEYVPGLLPYFSFDGNTFFMMPFRFGFDFMTGSYEQFFMYADENKVFFSLHREGSVWTDKAGTKVYIKFDVLDTVGMI